MESVRDLHVRVLLHGYVHAHVPEDADVVEAVDDVPVDVRYSPSCWAL